MVNRKLMVLWAVLLLSSLVACSGNEQAANPYANEAEAYYELYEGVEPIPLLTQSDSDFSYDKAYTFQEAFAGEFEEAGHEMMGYKLGLTGAKRPFGATEALYGRLFESMVEEDGVVELSDFVNGRLELEIAFFFEEDVSADATLEQIQEAVDTVAPAVELPDLMFADMQKLSWLDLIALDVAPRQLIIGEQVPIESVDVNSITVQATYNGETISEGVASNVMGDQWAALLFLAEKLEARGEQIKAGDVVITGAMSGLLPIEAGTYDVDYGEFGTVSFEVVE
jgi:2-keto-4-pentenoate hydratase